MFWKLALTSPAASVPDERSVSLSCAQPVRSAPAAFAWPGEKPAGDCPLNFAESLKLALVDGIGPARGLARYVVVAAALVGHREVTADGRFARVADAVRAGFKIEAQAPAII